MSAAAWSLLASLVGAAALLAAFMGYAAAGPVLLMGAFGLC
jgi:hypothetical protein